MIKIEFKEAQESVTVLGGIIFVVKLMQIFYNKPNNKTKNLPGFGCPDIKSISFGCPSELVPSRAEVLQQLGISKKQDDINQELWKI